MKVQLFVVGLMTVCLLAGITSADCSLRQDYFNNQEEAGSFGAIYEQIGAANPYDNPWYNFFRGELQDWSPSCNIDNDGVPTSCPSCMYDNDGTLELCSPIVRYYKIYTLQSAQTITLNLYADQCTVLAVWDMNDNIVFRTYTVCEIGPDISVPLPAGTYKIGAINPDHSSVTVKYYVCDSDNDGITDSADNCLNIVNPNQVDTDADGLGDACDNDKDNDGFFDGADNCPLLVNPDQTNTDGDSQGDVCDLDDDNDGVVDGSDNCPADPAKVAPGVCGCGVPEGTCVPTVPKGTITVSKVCESPVCLDREFTCTLDVTYTSNDPNTVESVALLDIISSSYGEITYASDIGTIHGTILNKDGESAAYWIIQNIPNGFHATPTVKIKPLVVGSGVNVIHGRITGDANPSFTGGVFETGIWGGMKEKEVGFVVVDVCPTTAPEFPSAFLPATMIIGFLGAVLLIQRTREH